MAMGPGPPQKKQREQREKERERERHKGDRGLNTGGVSSSAVTGTSSADTVVESEITEGQEVDPERHSGEGWNRRRYQREDELLWGVNNCNESRKGTHQKGRSRAGTTSSNGSYQYGCNPAVNDLHPPIVSTRPINKDEMRWMLQPPPPARVMEGKERANRSRSGSYRSNASSRRTETSLSRQMGERLIEERIRRDGEPDSPLLSRSISKENIIPTSIQDLTGQPHDRDRLTPNGSRVSFRSTNSQRKVLPPPLSITPDLRPPDSRPPLSTINSTSDTEKAYIAASTKPPRPTLIPMDTASSLHVLQELVSPLNLNLSPTEASSKLNIMRRATSPVLEANIRLPSATDTEEDELKSIQVESRFPAKAGWQLS